MAGPPAPLPVHYQVPYDRSYGGYRGANRTTGLCGGMAIMTAITGVYRAPSQTQRDWAGHWLHRWSGWETSDQRHMLVLQLLRLRRWYGMADASEFRNYLLWLGVYPSRIRGGQHGT